MAIYYGDGSNSTAGRIIQVATTTKTDHFSQSSVATNQGNLTNDCISVNITPKESASKILLIASLSIGFNSDNEVCWAFFKAGSHLTGASGDDQSNNRKQRTAAGDVRWSGTHNTTTGQYVDTAGGTSQITYSCRLGAGHNGTATLYLNRHHTNDNYAYDFDTQSTITAMEIAA
tara:strand:+ start:837 stop:1358 length:522 start_codon:yes stop_codon:yes gene_type:complete